MILRTIGLLFFGAAVLSGFVLGWDYSMGTGLYRMNPSGLNSLQAGVQRFTVPEVWDGIFVPILSLPAWVGWGFLGIVMFVTSALRAGKA